MAKIRGCHIGPPICTSFSLLNRVLMATTPTAAALPPGPHGETRPGALKGRPA